MAKKKISIEEAFAALEQAGIQVQVKQVSTAPGTTPPEPIVPRPDMFKSTKVGQHAVKINLFAKHTVGSGGYTEVDEAGDKHVRNAGVVTYGPGVVTVPANLADHLLHQDMLARQADEKMLDRTPKSYLIVRRQDSSGNIANVGVLVPGELLDGGLGDLPTGYMHHIG